MKTYIIGHTKPDVDSVVSAMAFEYLANHKKNFGYANVESLIASDINNETQFVLDKFNLNKPRIIKKEILSKDCQFVLVDHNEALQRSELVQNERIVEIIDHHKINVDFSIPIFITTKPWGSTTTIIWSLMREAKVTPPSQLAGAMLCAILSDTIGLRSSLTTEWDKKYVQELAELAQVDNIDELTKEIFKAKSDISKLTPLQKVKNDYKVFDFHGSKVLINQIETVEPNTVLRDKEELLSAMATVKETDNIDYIFCMISDILNMNTKLLVTNEDEQQLALSTFPDAQVVEDNVIDIKSRMSRKKDVAPYIERTIT